MQGLSRSLLEATWPLDSRPTVCVTGWRAGVDSVWEQKKLEARKILENAAESHTSGAHFVGQMIPQYINVVENLDNRLIWSEEDKGSV